jgi:hypothetical protein
VPQQTPEALRLWNAAPPSLRGGRTEGVGCPSRDTHVVASLRAAGASAVFFGHDHDNDFVGTLDAFRLGYG